MSKWPSRFVEAVPRYALRGDGAEIMTPQGPLLDFSMGLGAVILGYNHPWVTPAVQIVCDAPSLSLVSRTEYQAADALLEYVPWADRVRFGKSGTDVVTAAVRLARAVTGRNEVVTIGYHGWADWSVQGAAARGAPGNRWTLQADDLHDYDTAMHANPAAVVVEVCQDAHLDEGRLAMLRAWCDRHGALLIFDEVLSGFRWRMGSASAVQPDLICFGKAIGNGFSVSALVGHHDLMDEPFFFSGTFFGEQVGLAALCATLEVMEREDVPERLWERGIKLSRMFNTMTATLDVTATCVGDGPRTRVTGLTPGQAAYFQQECADMGLLFTGAHNMALAHTDAVIERALDIYTTALCRLDGLDDEAAWARVRGERPLVPYRVQ